MAADFIVAVDLGQAADYTAICAVQRMPIKTGKFRDENGVHGSLEKTEEWIDHWRVGHLERMPLHTPYPQVSERVKAILQKVPSTADLVVDSTGVGRPVVDMMRADGLKPIAATITSGGSEGRNDNGYLVPKKLLVSGTQILMQNGQLKISNKLALCETLVKEMLSFKVKMGDSGKASFEAWRESIHDDLVLALCLAIWWGRTTKTGWQKASTLKGLDKQMRASAVRHYTYED